MHIDARQLENNSTIEGDLCIVGAGAAGISLALEWIGGGKKVILLEGGGFEYEAEMQDLYAGKTTGQRYFPLSSIRLHFFGGTTAHWAGYCATFDPIDFKKRPWVADSGWPITEGDLQPYYKRSQPIFDLGPHEYSLDYWQQLDPELKPLPLEDKVLWNKMWQFSPPTRFNSKYKDTILKSSDVHLYTYANVTEITPNAGVSAIKSLTIKNLAGRTHTVKARQYVIACCAIQNARLLLASNSIAPNGLGNVYDQVGRYFMEHLEIKGSELWLQEEKPMKLYVSQFGKTKARAEIAIQEKVQEELELLNGTASFESLELARNQPSFLEVWTEDEEKNRKVMEQFGSHKIDLKIPPGFQAYQLFTRIEQAPNRNSRVTIDRERDALGVPRSNLHWELSSLEKKSIRKIHELIGREIGKAGKGRVQLLDYLHDPDDDSWPSFTGGGWHNMGTTRMAEDPKTGVVDRNCKVFGIDNLYMAGSSCFSTAGSANPTLSLVALTLRLSDHLKTVVH